MRKVSIVNSWSESDFSVSVKERKKLNMFRTEQRRTSFGLFYKVWMVAFPFGSVVWQATEKLLDQQRKKIEVE